MVRLLRTSLLAAVSLAVLEIASALSTAAAFTDDFNRPDSTVLGNGWPEAGGDLALDGGAVKNAVTSGYHTAVQPALAGASLTASADFARLSTVGSPRLGVVLRYQDAQNYYFLGRLTGGTSQLRIVRVAGGVQTVLGSLG